MKNTSFAVSTILRRNRVRLARTGAAAVMTLTAAGAANSTARAQSLLYFQGFESQTADNWSFTNATTGTGTGAVSTATGSGDTPASQRIFAGANSFQVNNASSTLSLSSVSTTGYTGAYLTLRLSSTSIGTGNGADGGDYVHAFVALNGGPLAANSASGSTADISLAGNTNARYGYNALLTATTTAGTNMTVAAPQGGDSTNNYSTFRINIPDGTTSVALRLNLLNDSANEVWNIDNISLFGTLAGPASKDLTFNPGSRNFNTDTANTNFVLTSGGTASAFTNGDTVRFTDTGVGTVTVDAGGVSPGGSFVSNTSGTYTFTGGAINGSGSVTKTGAGTLDLTGQTGGNGYTGGTNLNGGVTIVSSDSQLGGAAGGLSFDSGTLRTSAAITSARAITLSAGGGTVDSNGFNSIFTGNFSGTGALTKSGLGNLTISGNLPTNLPLAVTGGSLLLGQTSGTISLAAQAGASNFAGNLVLVNGIRVDLASGTITGGGQVQVRTTGSSLAANGSSSTATIGNNLVLNSTNATGAFVTNIGATSGNTLTVNGNISGASSVNLAAGSAGGAGLLILGAANTYTGATTINAAASGIIRLGIDNALPTATSLTFGSGTASANVGSLDLNGKNQTIASLSTNLGTSSTAAGVSNSITGTQSTLTVNGSAATSYASTIGGNVALVLASANTGTLTLSGANTYTGGTTVNNGTLTVNTGGTTGGATGALAVNAANGNTSVLNLNVDQTVGSLTGTVAGTGTSTINIASTKTLTSNQSTNTQYDGKLSGVGGIAKLGTGSLTLTGANDYTGGTSVGAGTLQVGTANSLPAVTAVTVGTSGATSNPGILNLNGLTQTIASLTLLGGNTSSTNSGAVTIGTNGVLTVNGTVSYETGSNNRYPSSITGGTLDLGGSTRTFAVNDNTNSTFGNDLDVVSVITNGGITKTLSGILRLSVANTLGGTTTVSAGTLALNNVNALQNSTLNTGTSGAQSVTFVVSGTNTYNLGGLQGSDALAIGANSLSVGSNNADTTMTGVISSTGGALTKTGNGALTLAGANTYTGGTTITGGKLLVTNTTGSATGTTGVSIGTAGTLASGVGTTGIITGLVTTAGTGSTIAPGATAAANIGTAGTLTLSGGLNAALGGTFIFDLGSASKDLIALGSGVFTAPTAVGSGLLGFNFNNLGDITAGTSYQLLTYGSMVNADPGDFTALTLPAGFASATFTVNGLEVDVSFTPVPEPTTVVAGFLALGTLGWSQRRRVRGFLAARRRRTVPVSA